VVGAAIAADEEAEARDVGVGAQRRTQERREQEHGPSPADHRGTLSNA